MGKHDTALSMDTLAMKVALVHDYLTQFGGAEQVLAVLARMYPDAPIATSLHDPDITLPGVDPARIHESMLGRMTPLRQHHRYGMPLFPLAMRQLESVVRDADVIIADSSAWSHQIKVRLDQRLLVYCHSPARFLYGDPDYLGAARITGPRAFAIHAAFAPYRKLDRRAWNRANLVLANSGIVARRLQQSIGVQADVVYPPVDTARFQPSGSIERGEHLLVVSRLVAHKAVDLVVRMSNEFNVPLRIIGTGREMAHLQATAGPQVEFLGFQPTESIRDEFLRCAAFVLPGAEDFGMTAVEAQAAGTPVLAFNRGGATESVLHQETGFLFREQTTSDLYAAYQWVLRAHVDPAVCMANADRFGVAQFEQGIRDAVAQVVGA